MRKGFSFAEIFVALVVIGVISTLTLPVITKTVQSQHKQLYRAAVQSLNSVVDELINDPSLYLTGEFTTGEQFCTDFISNTSIIGTPDCSSSPTIPGTPNFVTLNGMKWYFPHPDHIGDFDSTCPDSAGSDCLKIYIDVNGNRGINSYNATDVNQRDILKIYVSPSGKLYVPETSAGPERSYLTN